MREKFDNYNKQGRYILRLITTNTDIKKICQFCGKEAQLKNNRINPYEIQMVCRDCRKSHSLNPDTEMYDEIPLINVKEHINSKILSLNFIKLNEEQINKINNILNGGYTKSSAAKYMGVTDSYYNRLIYAYEKQFNVNIRNKLKILYKEAWDKVNVNSTLTNRINNKYNNISKIKLEKGISNRIIYERTGLQPGTISYICSGKSKPKNTSMVKIAEVLECSIADLFPQYDSFDNIKTMTDLKYYMMKIYLEIIFLFLNSPEAKFNKFIDKLCTDLEIPYETLRTLLISTKKHNDDIALDILSLDDAEKINTCFNEIDIRELTNEQLDKVNTFEKWKNKMKPRKHYK